MRLDPQKTSAYINCTWKDAGKNLNPLLTFFCGELGISHENVHISLNGTSFPLIECTYNHSITSALNTSSEHFIFCDVDVIPHPSTVLVFDSHEDVVCAKCNVGHPSNWFPGEFHTQFWWTSREVLEAIPQPFFEWEYNEEHTEILDCLCGTFAQKVKRVGKTCGHAGYIFHQVKETKVKVEKKNHSKYKLVQVGK